MATIKDVDTIIPGHSPVGTWNDFKEHAELLREFRYDRRGWDEIGEKCRRDREGVHDPGQAQRLQHHEQRVKMNAQMIVDN